jgi:hypothetical protein
MSRLPYPPLAFENLTQAIGIFRTGEIVEKRALFANLAWNVQGPLMALVFGDPDRTLGAVFDEDADHEADLEKHLDDFEGMLIRTKMQLSSVALSARGPDAQAIDPATILAIVNVVLQLLDAWRKRRQNPQPAPQPAPIPQS